jgi:hypothetical protein
MLKLKYKKIAAITSSTILLFIFSSLVLLADPVGTAAPTIQNPLGPGNTSVEAVLQKVMEIVSVIGGIVVVFFIIYSGYKFVTAGDSDTDRTKAKDTFFATIIGGAILLGAGIIASIVVNTVNSIK